MGVCVSVPCGCVCVCALCVHPRLVCARPRCVFQPRVVLNMRVVRKPASCVYARTGQHTCRARCVMMFHNRPDEFRLFIVFVSVETCVWIPG